MGTQTRALVAWLAHVASSCAPSGDEVSSEEVRSDMLAIRAELTRYYADFSARAWQAFADHFWPGATLTTVWQPPGEDAPRVVATSVPDFVRQAPEGPGSKPIFAEWMIGLDVRVSGDLAQAWASYGARFGEPGDVREWTGIDAFTLLRHEGRWRIVALAWAAGE